MRACWGSDCEIDSLILPEWFWESQPERVKAPYGKGKRTRQDPEYHETRETLSGDLVGVLFCQQFQLLHQAGIVGVEIGRAHV